MTKLLSFIATVLLCGCAAPASKPAHAAPTPQAAVPAHVGLYPSTYQVPQSAPTLIRNATVLTGTGARLEHADVLMIAGKVSAVGTALSAPAGALEIDGTDRWVTPGLIDVHSHLGVYPSPQVDANSDGNEATAPSTANVWAEHSVWPQDPGFRTALAGGITTLQILPGSANLIGGRSVVLKNVPSVTYQGMKFPDAPQGLKMACGENPKRVYGKAKGVFPETRMGNMAGYRAQWAEAQEYLRDQEEYQKKLAAGGKEAKDAKPPKRDLRLDTLAAALHGRHPRPHALLPRRRDGGRARHVAGVWLPRGRVPPRGRGLQDLRPARRARRVRGHVGRLVGLQDGGLRRHPGEHRLHRCRAGRAARSCTPTPRRASSASTRRRPRR